MFGTLVKQGRREDGGMYCSFAFSELDPLPPVLLLFFLNWVLPTESFMLHKWTHVLHGIPSYLNCCLNWEGRAKGLSWPSLFFCLQQWYITRRNASTNMAVNTPAITGPTPSRKRTQVRNLEAVWAAAVEFKYSIPHSSSDI